MDIEEFYNSDERRRASSELELGRDWHDSAGTRYELSWVEDTGELYAMREPSGPGGYVDPFGDWFSGHLSTSAVTVRILAHVPERAELERVLAGWQEAMPGRDSTAWVVERLRAADIAPEDRAEPEV